MGVNEKAWGIGFKRLIGDPSLGNGETYGICVDNTTKQLHILDIDDWDTNWGRSSSLHPELCIHSVTTPESNYLKMNHDGTDVNIDAVGATALNFLIGGTAELELTSSSFSPGVTGSNALGTTSLMWSNLFLAENAVINFNAGDVTLTHSSDTLTLAGGLDANKSTGATVNVNGIYETLTVTGDCTGTVCGIRARAITDGTARTIENFFGGNFDARLVNVGDRITGIMAGLQVAVSLGVMDVGAPWTYGINIDLTESGGARASYIKAFIDFQDYDYDGSFFCKSLLDIGGNGSKAAVGDKAAKKLVCNADVNGSGATDGGIQIIVNGTPMWLATYAI